MLTRWGFCLQDDISGSLLSDGRTAIGPGPRKRSRWVPGGRGMAEVLVAVAELGFLNPRVNCTDASARRCTKGCQKRCVLVGACLWVTQMKEASWQSGSQQYTLREWSRKRQGRQMRLRTSGCVQEQTGHCRSPRCPEGWGEVQRGSCHRRSSYLASALFYPHAHLLESHSLCWRITALAEQKQATVPREVGNVGVVHQSTELYFFVVALKGHQY